MTIATAYKPTINHVPEYIEHFTAPEDGLESFVFYNKLGQVCTGFKDADSGNMIEIRQNMPSLEQAIAYAKSLVAA